jgi:hypothetical protein
VSDVLKEFEDTALLGCRAVRAFLEAPATDTTRRELHLNAKAGAVAMSSYARLRATLANERQLRLLEERGLELPPAPAPQRRLKAGRGRR